MHRGVSRVMVGVVALALLVGGAAQAEWVTERANLNLLGQQSSGGSWAPTLNADGRYFAWHSWATDLVSNDGNFHFDVYVRDRQTQTSYLISVPPSGQPANGESLYPTLSANGLTVAFRSVASNLVTSDTNGVQDVFVRDWPTGQVERVSVSATGVQGNGVSDHCGVSGDGRLVVFQSAATNLIPGGNPNLGIYVRDRVAGTTECVSRATAGTLANLGCYWPSITPDGRYVIFASWAGNLVPGDTNNVADIFLRDRQTGTTEIVSLSTQGQQGNGTSFGSKAAITPDGRYVAFSSQASNFAANDTNGTWDVFVRDRVAGTTERVSVSTTGVQGNDESGGESYVLAISADGRYVCFTALASTLVLGDTNGVYDVFVRDRLLGTTERQSVSSSGAQGNGLSGFYAVAMSADGLLRVFDSEAHNLVAGDTSTCMNTFLRYQGNGGGGGGTPPTADFSANPTSGIAPLTVLFSDTSTGNPTSWVWSFGDSATSAARSPSHQYRAAGAYTVSLTATNAGGANTLTRPSFITVIAPHTLTVTANASPGAVNSGGTTNLTATATDSWAHRIAAWSWTDGGAGGTFSSTTVRTPTYTAPINTSGKNRSVRLTVTATCAGATPLTASASTNLNVKTTRK
jgi:Tol biopolymer transport system component